MTRGGAELPAGRGDADYAATAADEEPGVWLAGPADDPDRYVLVGPGITGGEGTTWRAYYRGRLNSPLALAVKVLWPRPGVPSGHDRQRWQDQAALLRHLRLERVVRLYEVFLGPPPHAVAGGDAGAARLAYLVMEWVDGPTLHQLLHGRRADAGSVGQRLRLVAEAGEALAGLQSWTRSAGNPSVHRDVKPTNCIANAQRGLVLIDVSGMRLVNDGFDAVGLLTAEYTAPEVLRDPYSPRTAAADVYSLGALAVFCLCGQDPPSADTPGAAARIERSLSAVAREAGVADAGGLVAHVMTTLHPDPAERPTDLTLWGRRLLEFAPPLGRMRRRLGRLAVLAAALLAVLPAVADAPRIPADAPRIPADAPSIASGGSAGAAGPSSGAGPSGRAQAPSATAGVVRAADEVDADLSTGTSSDQHLQVFACGSDGKLRHWGSDLAHGWGDRDQSLGGDLTARPVVMTSSDQHLQVFARGADGSLRHWGSDLMHGWGEQNVNLLGGPIVGAPAAVMSADGHLWVFARGAGGALRAWMTDLEHGWTTIGESLGGAPASAPVAVVSADKRLHVFARGDDGSLRHWMTDPANRWTVRDERLAGGAIAGAPEAVSGADGRLWVFARGPDGALRSWSTDSAYGWATAGASLGGALSSAPAAVVSADERLHVFARGVDGSLRHWMADPTNGWGVRDERLAGGSIAGAPDAVRSPDGHLWVFARGADAALRYWYTDRADGWTQADVNLGGFIM